MVTERNQCGAGLNGAGGSVKGHCPVPIIWAKSEAKKYPHLSLAMWQSEGHTKAFLMLS